MILHTVLPAEAIFPAEIPETELRTVAGKLCECIRTADGVRVSRLISTDPADFLNPVWNPGAPVPEAAGGQQE